MSQVKALEDPFLLWPDFKLEYVEVTDDEDEEDGDA